VCILYQPTNISHEDTKRVLNAKKYMSLILHHDCLLYRLAVMMSGYLPKY